MASIDWQKQTMQKAGIMQVHNNQQQRQELRHSNPDIDKRLTAHNYFIGTTDYSEAYQRMKKRTAEVDKDNPPRDDKGADRTVAISLVATCPQAISDMGEDREREFFEQLHEVYKRFFGEQNVHGTCVHKDEVHTYHDKQGNQRESLVHAHTLVSAYAEWRQPIYKKVEKQMTDKNGKTYTRMVNATNEKGKKIIEGYEERKGINGKNCETKARMRELNKQVHKMCLERFGVPYLTGEEAGKETVEEMKAKETLHQLTGQITKASSDLQEIQNKALEYQQPSKRTLESKSAYDSRVATGEQATAIRQRTTELDRKEQELRKREQQLQQRENEAERIRQLAIEQAMLEAAEIRARAEQEAIGMREVIKDAEEILSKVEQERAEVEKQRANIDKQIRAGVQAELKRTDKYNQFIQTTEEYNERLARLYNKPTERKENQEIETGDISFEESGDDLSSSGYEYFSYGYDN